ncbi:MAG: PAC2 family protein [Thermoguttaceae bacterium]|jgi:proteasome assembly chaperone (PAC2) family protein|nr:PAC2 family protein [Thermoguttaceae bacterium]
MTSTSTDPLIFLRRPSLSQGTLVLALSGWMDGGDVSTGTVTRLVHLLDAQPFAEIDPEPFYLFNFPGSMEIAALFRPHVVIEDGLVASCEMPTNVFSAHEPANLAFFIGKEPNLQWRTFGQCVFRLARDVGVRRIVFVGSFGGAVPHTREPRLYVTCSDAGLLPEMDQYGLRRSGYRGPGSFTSYLMSRAGAEGFEMVSLAAEIPSYLQGTNPRCIEAVTRRLAKMLKLPLDLASLRAASTEWELQISAIIEENQELANTVRQLEEAYDTELLQHEE